ncbi:hypothetical protein NIES2107_72010 (plasmid) [Nostoc carneum NIES-2107]|nr:hypothetical protein NIES2107_72010 [Nostoc carneum NIES-2107]
MQLQSLQIRDTHRHIQITYLCVSVFYIISLNSDTKSHNVCDTSIYSRGQGSALPLQSVAFFFQIGMTTDKILPLLPACYYLFG